MGNSSGAVSGIKTYVNVGGSGSGSDGTRYGIYNQVSGANGTFIYGVYNEIDNINSSPHYGVWNHLTSSGNGVQIGSFNSIDNSGNFSHYGTFNSLQGTGAGNKFGTYNIIYPSAGGTHYAVYGEATKTDSYAGYFVGDVYASQKLKAPASGNADMKAYIYGWIMASGSINISASSSGFSAEKESTGVYKITFSESNITSGQYIVIVTKQGTSVPRFVSASNYNGYFKVYIRDQSGNFTDGGFQFVVYKK